MKNSKAKTIIINLVAFFSYFIYEIICIESAYYFNIDFYSLSLKKKAVFLSISSILYIIFLLSIYKFEVRKDIDDFKKNGRTYIRKYLIYYIGGVILMGATNVIIQKITNSGISNNEELVRSYIKKIPLFMIYQSIIYAPLVEELVFRKSVKNIISNKYAFIIISGLIFGLLHIVNFNDYRQILLGIPYAIMGVTFAYIYYKTDNIFTTMTFHFFHNLILLIVQLVGGLM